VTERKERLVEILDSWVRKHSTPEGWAWFESTKDQLLTKSVTPQRQLFMAMGQIYRKLGKNDLKLSESDTKEAEAIRPYWQPTGWTVDQAARLSLLILTTPNQEFSDRLETLSRSADISELLAYYRGLPLFPDQEQYLFRATEGLRSNIKSVFEAVAHYNPYPGEQFDENAWNQMVLKAIFIGSPLWPISHFDKRNNINLAKMLCHYAHERWAASRTISPELWRAVGPFIHEVDSGKSDFLRVAEHGTDNEKMAALLSLQKNQNPIAVDLRNIFESQLPNTETSKTCWHDLTEI